MTFEDKMKLAKALYQAGEPVALKDTNGKVIHGEETLDAIVGFKLALKCRIIEDIDINEWKNSHWPQLFVGVRNAWINDNPRIAAMLRGE